MSDETTIKKLNGKNENENNIRNQAKRCLKTRVSFGNPQKNLDVQLFENSSSLYLNPTEKIFIKDLVKPGESFATVLGSCDFAIDASFHGAREILTFDVNKNQFYPASLKLKSLQNTGYDEFCNFLGNHTSGDYLSPLVYEKLKSVSKEDLNLYAFYDEMMKQAQIEQDRIKDILRAASFIDPTIFEKLGLLKKEDFEDFVNLDDILRQIIPYDYEGASYLRIICGMDNVKTEGCYMENESSYKKAQEAIKDTNISFLRTNIANMKNGLESTGYIKSSNYNRFNSIYLSNIPEYINGDKFSKIVDTQLMPLLQDDGMIVYCCQSTAMKSLNMSETELNELKNKARLISSRDVNIFSIYQLINSVEGLNDIRKNYNVDFFETSALSSFNGLENKDTYVYVKKRK